MIKVISRSYIKKNKRRELIEILNDLKKYAIHEKKCLGYEVLQDADNEIAITVISQWNELWHLESYHKSSYFINKVDEISDFITKESEINIYKILD